MFCLQQFLPPTQRPIRESKTNLLEAYFTATAGEGEREREREIADAVGKYRLRKQVKLKSKHAISDWK